MVQYILSRLKEPSTWAAIATVAVGLGITIDAELVQAICTAGAAIAAVLAILIKEVGTK